MPCAFQLRHPWRQIQGCQFAVTEPQLSRFDGKSWCIFHLPLKSGEAESEKVRWDKGRIEAFNEAVFACIDAAKEAKGKVDLSGVVFPGRISFERYGEENGLPEILFLEAVFGAVSFDRVTFGGSTTWFEGATFVSVAGFREAEFVNSVWFGRAIFLSNARFEKARFRFPADFRETTFRYGAWFQEATFGSTANFIGTSFSGAQFDGATFMGAIFNGANFVDGASFFGATFEYGTLFDGVTFSGDVRFTGDPERKEPTGYADAFRGVMSFRKARFNGRAVFINRRFHNTTDFREATFKIAPEFHNGVLHQDTRFSRTRFLDRTGTDEVDAASAYRTLKLAMESVRARDEEARFYAYEQQSLRAKKDIPCSVWLFSWLYEKTADYGRSFMRPLAWLFGASAVFYLVYLAAMTGTTITWDELEEVLWFGSQQVFHPFWAFRGGTTVSGTAEAVPLWLALVAALHSLLMIAFLTLFLLAVRRRFKLD